MSLYAIQHDVIEGGTPIPRACRPRKPWDELEVGDFMHVRDWGDYRACRIWMLRHGRRIVARRERTVPRNIRLTRVE